MNARAGRRSVQAALGLAFLLALIAQPMMAQSQNITGLVVDATGAVVPGPQSRLRRSQGRDRTSDQHRRFRPVHGHQHRAGHGF